MHSGRQWTSGRCLHGLLRTAALLGLVLTASGCNEIKDNAEPSHAGTAAAPAAAAVAGGGQQNDSACTTALGDISKYGPSTVKLAAEGHDAVSDAMVRLLVDGLDGAADMSNTPQVKQPIQRVANDYDDYFHLTTDAVSIPLSTLLADTSDLESRCN